MEGWMLYSRPACDLNRDEDHGVYRLLDAAAERGVSLTVYTPNQLDVLVTHADEKTILLEDVRVTRPDFVISRLGANISYKGLALLRTLEHLGVYVCNGSHAHLMSKDKLHMVQLLNHEHIPTPKTMLMKYPASMTRIASEIGFPLVMKMVSGAKGFGVHLCQSEDSLEEIIEILSVQADQTPIILQEFMDDSFGRDLRVFVLGGQVLGCMLRVSGGSFKANYSRGGRVEPYAVTPEIETLALQSAALFGLEIAGIDLLFDNGSFKVCEANSAPGFKGMELASGLDIAGQIMDYIQGNVEARESHLRP